MQKAYVEHGCVKVVGERIVAGRRALETQSAPPKWRSAQAASVTTAVVDAATFQLYERSTVLPNGEVSQREVHEVTELLPATDATVRARLAKARKRPRR